MSSLALTFSVVPAGAKMPKLKKPGPPINVTTLGVEDGSTITWVAPTSDGGSPITGYTAKVQNGGCSTTGATTCTVTGLTDGRDYTVKVRAVNAVGIGRASRAVKFVADQAPDCSDFVPGADLEYCRLGGQNLDGDDLAGANLSGAGLNGTLFEGTDLDGAVFDAGVKNSLTGASFDGAQMVGAEFNGMYLEYDDFGGTNLDDSQFTGADLVTDGFDGATMAGADLSGTSWNEVECPDGTLSDNDGNTCLNNLAG